MLKKCTAKFVEQFLRQIILPKLTCTDLWGSWLLCPVNNPALLWVLTVICCIIHRCKVVKVTLHTSPFPCPSQSDQCRLLLCRLSDCLRCSSGKSKPCPADGCHLIWHNAVCRGGIHHPRPPSCESHQTQSCHTGLNYCPRSENFPSNIAFFVMLISTVQRCWWLHGHSRLWGVLWFGHLLGPLPTKPTPKQTPQWICLPLWCVCHDWWVTKD